MAEPYWELEQGLPPSDLRSAPDGGTVFYGRFVEPGEWTEIRVAPKGISSKPSASVRSGTRSTKTETIRCLCTTGKT